MAWLQFLKYLFVVLSLLAACEATREVEPQPTPFSSPIGAATATPQPAGLPPAAAAHGAAMATDQ